MHVIQKKVCQVTSFEVLIHIFIQNMYQAPLKFRKYSWKQKLDYFKNGIKYTIWKIIFVSGADEYLDNTV